jgi:LPS O-antigen subunit length determinant protein (WzzB/FepE family)
MFTFSEPNIEEWLATHEETVYTAGKAVRRNCPSPFTKSLTKLLVIKRSPPDESPKWAEFVMFAAPIEKNRIEQAREYMAQVEQQIAEGDLTAGGKIREHHIQRVQEKK